MNRNDFGLWGVELSPEDFRRALAVLGLAPYWLRLPPKDLGLASVIEEAYPNPLKWRDPLRVGYYRDEKMPPAFSAPALADAWKAVVENYGEKIGQRDLQEARIRFEVRGPDLAKNLWYIEQLSTPEVRATSAYCRIRQEPTEIVWDWPLRVGLLNDQPSRQLRSQLEVLYDLHPWVGKLAKFVDFQTGETECDLLVLPQNLRSALTAILQAPRALNTDCVLVLGRFEDTELRSLSLLDALRTQTRASGIALTYVPPTFTKQREPLQAIWFKEFIRHVSHNQPIDVALYRACRDRDVNVNTPLLFATRELVSSSLVTRRLEQFSHEVLWAASRRYIRALGEDEIGYDRYRILREKNFRWAHESDSASEFLEAKEAAQSELSGAPLPPPKNRWIQTEVWEHREGGSHSVKHFLRSKTTYRVVVFIGMPTGDAISADKPFNEEDLPPNKNEHELIVNFSEPQISPEPQVATIVLPKEGNSSQCDFYIHIPSGIIAINARIAILHRNRILQTALLKASVQEIESANVAGDETIQLIVESVIRPGMRDLSSRTWFDGAFILNHAADDTAQITKSVGKRVTRVQIADLSPTIKWFDDQITEVAEKWKKFEPLKSKKSQKLLWACAMNGATLYDGIIQAQRADDALVTAERVQVLSTRYGARFPVEFIYGRMAPKPNAPLCPKAKESLLTGSCDAACPTGNQEETVICPLGFWGLNRVIERHAYDPEDAKNLAGADFGIQSEPVTGRNRLNVLASAVVATSNNVDSVEAGSKQKVVDALSVATGKQSNCVDSWDDWVRDIDTRSPSLLVLLPHTLRDVLSKQQTLEISADQRLIYGNLQRKHVVRENSTLHPVVILMGCKTAAPDIPYESFVLKFRMHGAALVIATGSSILGRHAATVTQNFIADIAAIKSTNITFGELMLNVRRKLMADGLLMGLCLTSYGDTDWLL
jgi:hypothetical protein